MDKELIRKYKKIAIVEDDLNLQQLLVKNLKKEGFDCTGFSEGKSLIEYILKERDMIILLDQKLPDMTGKDLIDKIHSYQMKIPFIVMTGQGDEKLAVEMMKKGASDYLIKDMDLLDILPEVLDKLLSNLLTEIRLKDTENSLKIALDKNTALLNSFPDLMFLVDSDFIFKDFFPKNAKDNHLFNLSELIGENILNVFHPEVTEKIYEKVNQVFLNGKTELYDYSVIYDDQALFYESRFVPFGKNEVLIIERNVTEKKKTEEEKERLKSQLLQSQKLESIGRLAGGVAHDFNNMLNGIMGAAQLIQFTGVLDAKSKEYVDLINKTAERAAELTAKLLLFSRRNTIAVKNVNIHDLINDSISILNRSIEKRIDIIKDLSATQYEVSGEPSMIQNAFINMGINASHAMPDGGTLTFKTSNVFLDEFFCKHSMFDITPGSYVQIEIIDTGCGISPENMTKIFDPFFTTKEPGKGTGLGLSIVYGLVRDSKGAISVESEMNKGTAFSIYFPISKGITDKSILQKTIKKGTGKILLVDDEHVVLRVGTDLLSFLGYDVMTATNGEEAVEIYRKHKEDIQVVVLDMIMPKMGGKEAFFKLKEINQAIKIVIASGYF
jgi:signal transduction histidine kinase/DNA-binding response OmpR family regulator